MKYSPMAQPAYGAMYCMGALVPAPAATTIVYSMAPFFFSVSTTPAIVDSFWPTATYTHTTASGVPQYFFWLMIASRHTAVLPVLRSPMTSSRWPRPTGIMLSTALMPNCSGSFTGWRSLMPGATMSTFMLALALIAGPPSMALPSGSTTRPSISGPAGTSSRRPVLRTVSPSRTRLASPNSTAPTMSVSRFITWPVITPPSASNSSSSPAITLLRP